MCCIHARQLYHDFITIIWITGGSRLPNWEANLPVRSPPLPSSSLSLPFSFLRPFPSLPLEVGPLNTARGPGGALSAPQWGLERSPMQQKSNLVHFSLKIWHLVAPILLIFLRIIWSLAGLGAWPDCLPPWIRHWYEWYCINCTSCHFALAFARTRLHSFERSNTTDNFWNKTSLIWDQTWTTTDFHSSKILGRNTTGVSDLEFTTRSEMREVKEGHKE